MADRYVVVQFDNVTDVELLVNELIKYGYNPVGGISVVINEGTVEYLQAMLLDSKEKGQRKNMWSRNEK